MSYSQDEPRPALTKAPLTKAPLTKRMRQGHWMAIDCAVGAIAALLAMFSFWNSAGPPRIAVPTDVLLGATVFFPVALRRSGPVAAYGVLIAVGVIVAATGSVAATVVFVAAAYVLYLVTATSNRQTGAAALALALAAMGLIVVGDRQLRGPSGVEAAYVPVVFAVVIAWMTGYSVRQRRLYAQTLQHQAASSAVAEERLRIARELHDVVAHSMSVIAVQAGYGQYVIDSSPADAKDALGAIQATSRDALEEMRRMLGVLRQQDAIVPGVGRSAKPAPLTPAPGLSDLDRLIQRTCGAGVEVSLERSGLVRAVPAGVDMSAYRIIQEALTNVVKHAGAGAYCGVSLRYGAEILDIQVTDDGGRSLVLSPVGAAPAYAGDYTGAGHGIIGMRERTNLCGGRFNAGPLPAGGFQVTVALPLLSGPGGSGGADGGDGGDGTRGTGSAGSGSAGSGSADSWADRGWADRGWADSGWADSGVVDGEALRDLGSVG
jgi:signal transduction histidine kinase